MNALVIGAVAYDPKVVTIWDGFRSWLRERNIEIDVLLYGHYERQVDDLVSGQLDAAWNSPMAWVRSRRLAESGGLQVDALAMRDTDRDLVSVVVVRSDSSVHDAADLANARIGVGAIDSPQATLLPLSTLRAAGVPVDRPGAVYRHQIGVGLHGDHLGGERAAVQSLLDGRVDAACVTDANLLLFGREGTIEQNAVRVVAQTEPYDHCMMTGSPHADRDELGRFTAALLAMSYADETARPLLDLEGLTQWLPGRRDQYDALEQAVDEAGFYGKDGQPGDSDYRP